MTYHTDEEKTFSQDDNTSQDEEVLCEELDLSSCCEVESTPIAEENISKPSTSVSLSALLPPSSVETTEEKHLQEVPVNGPQQENYSSCNVNKFHDDRQSEAESITRNNTESSTPPVRKSISNTCALPKKKRPLPKEFLEELAAEQQPPTSKQSRPSNFEDSTTTTTNTSVAVSTPATTTSVTSQSWSTSTTVSTVCSTIGVTTNSRRDVNPKVVVQLTQSLDYTFPLTCTQILLHHHSVYDKLSRRALA